MKHGVYYDKSYQRILFASPTFDGNGKGLVQLSKDFISSDALREVPLEGRLVVSVCTYSELIEAVQLLVKEKEQ